MLDNMESTLQLFRIFLLEYIIFILNLFCSSSLDSPATSMQDMASSGGRSNEITAASTTTVGGASFHSSSASQFGQTQSYWDSDFETEPDPPDWRHSINQEELNQLNPREKKRQDVINGEPFLIFPEKYF